jgi:hypothetical protein
MTHSLFLAQQSANHRLEELEDQAMGEPASEDDYGDPLNPSSPLPVSPISADAANRRQRNGSIVIDGINNSKSPTSTPLQAKRTSVLLNECLFDGEKSAESTRRRTLWPLDRRQSLFQTDKLLKRLIEQAETPISGEQDHPQQSNEEQVLSESIQESYSTQETWPVLGTNIEIHEHDVGFQANTAPAAEEGMFRESSSPPIINDQNFNKPITKTLPFSSIPNDEITTPFRGNIDDTCQGLLSGYVQKYSTALSSRGYPLDWRQYALYIVLGEHERSIGLEEKPLRLYKNLEKEGKNPSYILRHMASSGMSYTVQRTGLRSTNLASEQLDYCYDVFLAVLGSFLGLHMQFRSSSELLLTTQQSFESCRELLTVVEVVLDHDLRRSDTLLEAKDAMYDKITELVHAAREAFSPATADEDSVFLPDEGKSIVNAVTACVRGAGGCVAKTRMVLEQIGDFELESAEVRSPTVTPNSVKSIASISEFFEARIKPLPHQMPTSTSEGRKNVGDPSESFPAHGDAKKAIKTYRQSHDRTGHAYTTQSVVGKRADFGSQPQSTAALDTVVAARVRPAELPDVDDAATAHTRKRAPSLKRSLSNLALRPSFGRSFVTQTAAVPPVPPLPGDTKVLSVGKNGTRAQHDLGWPTNPYLDPILHRRPMSGVVYIG